MRAPPGYELFEDIWDVFGLKLEEKGTRPILEDVNSGSERIVQP
jgi:hypothetical protein